MSEDSGEIVDQRLYHRIADLRAPFDILVAAPGDFEKHNQKIGLIYRTILQEGREVYAS